MRIILFRAAAAVNDKSQGIKAGDMVCGQFIQSGVDAPCIIFGDGEQIEIKPETLGQYLGMEDRNGTSIFEGDALRSHHDDGDSNYFGYVEWLAEGDWFGWSVNSYGSPEMLHIEDSSTLEVIGNIHDNPALAA